MTAVPQTAHVSTVTAGEITIEVEHGLAFGTGHHATTRLAIDLLRRRLRPGMRLLELGVGTGVLAIIAAKLGAARVLALDIDEDAAWLARRNITRNDVESIVQVELGSLPAPWPLAEPPTGCFEVITANLGAAAIGHLVDDLLAALAPGGVLIAGGIAEELEPQASEALAAAGEVIIDTVQDGMWRALVVARR